MYVRERLSYSFAWWFSGETEQIYQVDGKQTYAFRSLLLVQLNIAFFM